MAKLSPALREAQKKKAFKIGGTLYPRVPCGHERGEAGQYVLSEEDATCIDCGAPSGFLHLLECDNEECPKCHGHAASCRCQNDRSETWR